MWFDGNSTIQLFPQDFEKLLNDNGWVTFAKYRSVNSLSTKFAEVRLFRSVGSDGEVRHFGMAFGYGYNVKPEYGEQDFISPNSILGVLDRVEGTNNKYKFKIFPIIKDSVILYKNGQVVPPSEYALDDFHGEVLFTNPPADTDKITASYSPSPIAPQPVKRVYFFTFDDIRPEKIVQGVVGEVVIGDPESILPDGDGVTKEFQIPTFSTIKQGTVRVYINHVEQDPSTYTVDYQTNKIIFNTPPDMGAEIHASYVKTLSGEGTTTINYGDIPVKDFNPDNGESLMNAVYSAIHYIYPSLPTALSFTPLDNFDRGWQRDSTLYYWGNITKDRIVMFFRPDPTPGADFTYFAPLYIGRITLIGKPPRRNHVIIAGCRQADEIKWNANKKLGAVHVDYGKNTSNGNSSIQLQQSIGGTYYQSHYLAFITHDKFVDNGEARFNPSIYSGKYHISPIYIVHPNDGFVGKLDEVYAVHPKNISQLDELEVSETAENEYLGHGDGVKKVFHLSHQPSLKDDGTPFRLEIKVDCELKQYGVDYTLDMETKAITFTTAPPDGAEILATYDYKQIYRYTMPDTPVCPFTLDTISPFAPIGIAILKETLNKNS